MATTNRQSNTDLKQELLDEGRHFEYLQALRLLERLVQHETAPRVDTRPALSLAFPASDISSIEEQPEGYSITATFLGLYGVATPLPAFYTEDLLRDAVEDSSVTRDFLDLIHRRLYAFLFDGWKKYRLFVGLVEAKAPAALELLHALSGLSDGTTPWSSYRSLRYTGLLGCRPRSALGLQTLLADYFGDVPIDIQSFIPRRVKIPTDQQFQLGRGQNVLGENSFIGQEFMDVQGKFRVRLGPLDRSLFRAFLQGGKFHEDLVALIDRFLSDPLDYDIELILDGKHNGAARLGAGDWSSLGMDMMLYSGTYVENFKVVFPPTAQTRAPSADHDLRR